MTVHISASYVTQVSVKRSGLKRHRDNDHNDKKWLAYAVNLFCCCNSLVLYSYLTFHYGIKRRTVYILELFFIPACYGNLHMLHIDETL